MEEENTSRSLKVATELFLRGGKSSSHIRGRIFIPTAKATLLVSPPRTLASARSGPVPRSLWPSLLASLVVGQDLSTFAQPTRNQGPRV